MTYDECVMAHKTGNRTAVDGLYLCTGCLDHLEQLVAGMPARYGQLERALATGGSGGQRVSGSASEPLPINLGVAEHRADIAGKVASWALLVSEERGITPPASPAIAVCAPWLTVHVRWCAGNRWVDEMLSEMRRLDGRARALLDPPRRLATGERCRAVDEEDVRCDGTVAMVVDSADEWMARCSVCGIQEAGPYLHDKISGRWVTVERVVAYALRNHKVRVAPATVRDWVRRGHVENREEQGTTWYELGSIRDYLEKRRAVAS